jgi:hypothetical protein
MNDLMNFFLMCLTFKDPSPIYSSLGCLFWITITLLSLIFGILINLLINTVGVKPSQGVGVIVEKTFRARYYSYPRFRPESFTLTVELNNKTGTVEVSPTYYNKAHSGDRVTIRYKVGRFDSGLYIKGVYDRIKL